MINFILSVGTTILIQALLALGMDLQYGLAGLLNLSYIFFVAIGAYVTSVFMLPASTSLSVTYILGLNMPWLVGAAVATLASCAVALVVGAVALRRLRSDYFAIFTLVLAAIALQTTGQYQPLFNGAQGLFGIPAPFATTLGVDPGGTSYSVFFFLLTLVCLIVVYLFVRLIRRSQFGRVVRAARDDEMAVMAFGRSVVSLKLRAFVIGAGIAGFGGSLVATYTAAYNPTAWSLGETLLILNTILVGGVSSSRGIFIGNVLVIGAVQGVTQYLPTSTSYPYLSAALRFIVVGVLIIAVLRWRPRGLLPERFDVDRAVAR